MHNVKRIALQVLSDLVEVHLAGDVAGEGDISQNLSTLSRALTSFIYCDSQF